MKKVVNNLKQWLDTFKDTSVIGLDIGEDNIKLTEVDTGWGKIVLNSLGIVDTPREAVKDGKLIDPALLAEVLEPILKDNKFSTNKVMTAISGEAVITRVIEIPNMPREEVGEAVRWEAGEQIPVPIEEVIIDYEILDRGDGGTYNILIIAVKKELIDKYLELFELLKLEAVAIEIEPMAIARTVGKLYKEDSIGIIDIGTKTTDISILNKGQLLFTRTVGMGGVDISQDIADNFEMEFDKAEEYKKENNLFTGEYTSLILRTLVTDVYRSLDYFQVNHKGIDIEKIIITGGGSKLVGLDRHLTDEFGVKIERLDLANRLMTDLRSQEDVSELAQLLGVSIGLALRGEDVA